MCTKCLYKLMPSVLAIVLTIGMIVIMIGLMLKYFVADSSEIAVILITSYTSVWTSFMSIFAGKNLNTRTDNQQNGG